jgi:hypothetical protein
MQTYSAKSECINLLSFFRNREGVPQFNLHAVTILTDRSHDLPQTRIYNNQHINSEKRKHKFHVTKLEF